MKGLKSLVGQWASLISAGIAAACCLGVPIILSTLTTLGLGFLINDAYLFPVFTIFVSISVVMLYFLCKKHGNLIPFWIGLYGSVIGTISLWMLVTGLYALPVMIYLGLGSLVVASVWDFINGRRKDVKSEVVCETGSSNSSVNKQVAKGISLSLAAAGIFYGMYKSVELLSPSGRAEKSDIACWGVNSCRGRTACSTAFNSCTGMNSCKEKGYIYVSQQECKERGGVLLKGSKGDPA